MPVIRSAIDVASATQSGIAAAIASKSGIMSSSIIVQPAVIVVPAGAIGVYSVVKTSIGGVPWAGNCLQVKRASDHTTLDIGWNGNVVDWAAADAFAAGSVLEACIWYDQSGSGNNFANATNDRAPLFQRESHWKGIRPLTGELLTNSLNPRGLFVTWAVAPDQNAMTIYHVGAPRSSFENMMYFDGETASFAGSRVNLADTQAATGIKYNRNGSGAFTSLCTVSQLECVALSSTVVDINGTQLTFAAASSNSTPCMQLFASVAGGGTLYDYLGDKFLFAVYPASHDAATITANRALFLNPFSPNTATQTKEIIYGGNSMQVASRATKAKSLAWLCGFGRASEDDAGSPFALQARPEWRVRNTGVSGRTLANEIANWTLLGSNVVDTGLSRKIYVMGSATNDINNATYANTAAAQTAMDTLYTSMTGFVTTLKSAGVDSVIIVTMIPITGAQLGTGNFREDARVYLNNKITTGAVAGGYTVSDWCSLTQFSTQSSYSNTTYYFTDGIHPNDMGYGLIAPLDLAAILAA